MGCPWKGMARLLWWPQTRAVGEAASYCLYKGTEGFLVLLPSSFVSFPFLSQGLLSLGLSDSCTFASQFLSHQSHFCSTFKVKYIDGVARSCFTVFSEHFFPSGLTSLHMLRLSCTVLGFSFYFLYSEKLSLKLHISLNPCSRKKAAVLQLYFLNFLQLLERLFLFC